MTRVVVKVPKEVNDQAERLLYRGEKTAIVRRALKAAVDKRKKEGVR